MEQEQEVIDQDVPQDAQEAEMQDEAEAKVETDEEGNRIATAEAGTKLEDGTPVKGSATWKPGNSLEEAVSTYGEKIVYEYFIAHGTRNLTNSLRGLLRNGVPPEQAQERLTAEWAPGKSLRITRSPEDNVLANFDKLSPEKQQEILQALLAKAQQG